MRSRQLAEMLTALAEVAEATRADELRRFAAIFRTGGDDTVAARLKNMSRSHSHPAVLHRSLQSIRSGLAAAGAKQGAIIEKVLGLFGGPDDAELTAFLHEITTPPLRQQPIRKKPVPAANHQLAQTMADRLTDSTLDTEAFSKVVEEFRSAKLVNTPTLVNIAHRYLGNDKPYSGRKAAIDDIIRRQKADVREHARGKALSRIGV